MDNESRYHQIKKHKVAASLDFLLALIWLQFYASISLITRFTVACFPTYALWYNLEGYLPYFKQIYMVLQSYCVENHSEPLKPKKKILIFMKYLHFKPWCNDRICFAPPSNLKKRVRPRDCPLDVRSRRALSRVKNIGLTKCIIF